MTVAVLTVPLLYVALNVNVSGPSGSCSNASSHISPLQLTRDASVGVNVAVLPFIVAVTSTASVVVTVSVVAARSRNRSPAQNTL